MLPRQVGNKITGKKTMKLRQHYPRRIREALTHIENQMDYLQGTKDEYIGVLQELILSQQSLIHCILEHVYHDVEVPTEPVGIWATNYEFDEWLRIMETSIYHTFENPILADMKKGEIVILRDPSYIECAGISSSMYKHDDRGIDVSINVSAPNHFRCQYKRTHPDY
jgi:hypothetical protein